MLLDSPKILIVDDDPVNGEILKKRLEKKGYLCDYVDSGEKCLEKIDSTISLILLDIMMPGISGIDVLKEIRKKYNNIELPVMMVTAKEESEGIVEALRFGANDYLTKPVNVEIANARIGTQLKLRDLVHESLKAKQVQTMNTMVTTLNHEINNPLAIAIGNLSIAKSKIDPARIDKALMALDRITQIVKRIDEISSGNPNDIEEVSYSEDSSMFDLSHEK